MILNLVFGKRWTFRPGLESPAQLGFRGRRVKVSADTQNDVVGMDISVVPVGQILARDCGDGRVLRRARVGIFRAIRQLDGFAVCDSADLIVAARDAVLQLLLREVELFCTEFGILQQVGEDFEDIVEIAFQAIQADAG